MESNSMERKEHNALNKNIAENITPSRYRLWSESVDFSVELNLIASLRFDISVLEENQCLKVRVLMSRNFSIYLYIVSYDLLLLINNISVITPWIVLILYVFGIIRSLD